MCDKNTMSLVWMCDKIWCDYSLNVWQNTVDYSLNVWQNTVWLQSECVTKYGVITVWMCDKIWCDYSLNVWQNTVWLQSECVTKYSVITVWMCDKIRCDYSLNVWQNTVWLQSECVTKYGVITVWMCDKNMVWCLTYLVIFSCEQAALWMVFSVCLSVCPSVCLSVTPFWLCSHHRIIMKFSGVITTDQGNVHAKDQGQRSKVKVTEVTTQLSRFRTVTPV